MKSKQWTLLLILVALLTITGCASNPDGSLGPSWDVPIRVPAVKEEQVLNDFSDTDEFGEFGYKINGPDDIDFSLYGEQNNEIKKTLEVDLPLLEFESGLVNVEAEGPIVNGRLESELTELEFPNFDALSLSNSYNNSFNLTVANTGSNPIDDLTIKLKDTDGSIIATSNFSSVAAGSSASGVFELSGQTLKSGMKLVTAIDQSSGQTSLDFTMTSAPLKVTKVEGLDAGELDNTSLDKNFSTNLDIGNQSPTVIDEDPEDDDDDQYGAHLDLDFKFPQDTNLKFNLSEVLIGGTAIKDQVSPDQYYDIERGTNLNTTLAIAGSLTNTADKINYDSSKTIELSTAIYGGIAISQPDDVELKATTDNYLLYKLDASEFDLDNDDLDNLDENLKDAKLVIDYENELGVSLTVDLYVANTNDKTELYQPENKAAEIIDLEAGAGKHEFSLDKEFRDKFRNQTYLGIKIRLGNGEPEVSFSSVENLSLEAFAVLTSKVNQDQ
mgnify:FL=1